MESVRRKLSRVPWATETESDAAWEDSCVEWEVGWRRAHRQYVSASICPRTLDMNASQLWNSVQAGVS